MKFITSLKFLVLLIVALSVFTKKVKRSATATKSATRLDKMAFAYGYCDNIKNRYVNINTESANSGLSGFIVRNYYKNQSFDCTSIIRIADDSQKNQYFVAYRKFAAYSGPYKRENGWATMRQLVVPLVNNGMIVFNIDKHVFSDTINESELSKMQSNLDTNKSSYSLKFRKYREEMIVKKTRAQDLTDIKASRITNRAELNAVIAKKNMELTTTKDALKSLNDQAEASRTQIRNFEKEINVKQSNTMDPAMQTLKETIQNFDALVSQKADNDKKIQGIIPIDSNDLVKSTMDLKSKLAALQALYIESDPKSGLFSTLIAHLDTQIDTIPTVIA
jgi:hypothetical protein